MTIGGRTTAPLVGEEAVTEESFLVCGSNVAFSLEEGRYLLLLLIDLRDRDNDNSHSLLLFYERASIRFRRIGIRNLKLF